MIEENPDLEMSLDGLFHAHMYALDIGEEELAREIFDLYQEMAKVAPDEDFDWYVGDEWDIDEEKTSAQGAMERNPLDEEEDYES